MVRNKNRSGDRELEALVSDRAFAERPGRGRAFSGPAGFVLARGRAFEPYEVADAGPECEAAGHCHANALLLVLRDNRLAYAEGFALSRGGAVMAHAWAVDRIGRAYEPTWSWLARPRAYLGVAFDTDYLIDALVGTRTRSRAG